MLRLVVVSCIAALVGAAATVKDDLAAWSDADVSTAHGVGVVLLLFFFPMAKLTEVTASFTAGSKAGSAVGEKAERMQRRGYKRAGVVRRQCATTTAATTCTAIQGRSRRLAASCR